jgi:uncharacterized protein YbjT (DUF2867 family)
MKIGNIKSNFQTTGNQNYFSKCNKFSVTNSSSPNSNSDCPTKTSLLVVGATGSLGRQIVRLALNEGFDVKCMVRPRETPVDFLRDWGATVVNADLRDPTSIPMTLIGIHTVIDAATARPEESIQTIDWDGKVALIQAAQAIGVQKYIFYSISHCEKYPNIPLMSVKACTEDLIKNSDLKYTIFRLSGFMQSIIGNYAVPILERKSVWGSNEKNRTPYIDTQDIAKMTIASLSRPNTNGRTITIAGPKSWTTDEVIELCETLSGGSKAKIIKLPTWVLKATRYFLSYFQPAKDAADRLAFTDLAPADSASETALEETCELLGIDSSEMQTLESYLDEYFNKIIKKLNEVGAESRQTDFYV